MKNQRHACPQAGPFPQCQFQPVGSIGHSSDGLGQFRACQPVLVCFDVQHDAAVCARVQGSQDGELGWHTGTSLRHHAGGLLPPLVGRDAKTEPLQQAVVSRVFRDLTDRPR